jgi:spore coat protein U-like protein
VIPYSVSTPTFSPGTASGPGVGAYKAATFTGTVQPSAYMDAVAGTYGDTLIVTVTP